MNNSKKLEEIITEELAIIDIPEETRENIVNQLGELLIQSVLAGLYDESSEEEKSKIQKLLDEEKDNEEIWKGITSLSKFEEIAKREVLELKEKAKEFLE